MYIDIYNYWFDYTKMKNIQRHWIPISEKETKHSIKSIDTQFSSIYFQTLFKIFSTNNLHFYNNLSFSEKIGFIILLDQFTRTLSKKYKRLKIFKIICSKLLFLKIHEDFILHKNYLHMLPDEIIFIFMVYKHINQDLYRLIFKKINTYCRFNKFTLKSPECTQLQKFYIDSYEKYIKYQFTILSKESMDISKNYKYRVEDIYKFLYLTDIDGQIYKDFFQLRMNPELCYLDKEILRLFQSLNITGDVCISLSGGVDSMVLTYILKKLETYLDISVKVFHLNYQNRIESNDEVKFLWTYCNLLNIPIYVYTIPYLRRDMINRESYERITRHIRFSCYSKFTCPIVLGHIYDDKIENIFTNISTHKHIFNLSKIKLEDTIENISILRPFVNIKKTTIYEYSNLFQIPYLNNTTPLWSNRGSFRNNFIQSYLKQYNEDGLYNIVKLSATLEQYGKLIHESVITPVLENLKNHHWTVLPITIIQNTHLLRDIFTQFCHNHKISMPSEKSILGLQNVLLQQKNQKYQLSKNVLLYIQQNSVKYI